MQKRLMIILFSILISACGRKTVQNENELTDAALVFDKDNRMQIHSHKFNHTKAVGHLQIYYDFDDSPRACTATLIDNQYIITAAHCFYNESKRKHPVEVIFTPGALSETTGNLDRYFVTDMWVHKTYIRYHNTGFTKGIEAFDLAVGKLDAKVQDISPLSFDLVKKKEKSRSGIIVHYPGDKEKKTQWQSFCTFSSRNKRVLKHKCDTISGSSGAPVLFYHKDSKTYKVKGIHHGGSKDVTNYATRIEKKALKDIKEILNGSMNETKNFKFVELDINPTYQVSVENKCNHDIKLAVVYKDESKRMRADGVFHLPVGQTYHIAFSSEDEIYFSAYDNFSRPIRKATVEINSDHYGHLDFYDVKMPYRYQQYKEVFCN